MDIRRSGVTSIANTLEGFIRIEGGVAADDPDFSWSVDLLEAGYLDSLGLVHLFAFIEQEYGMVLSDEVLADPRIATIKGIATILDEEVDRHAAHADRSAGI